MPSHSITARCYSPCSYSSFFTVLLHVAKSEACRWADGKGKALVHLVLELETHPCLDTAAPSPAAVPTSPSCDATSPSRFSACISSPRHVPEGFPAVESEICMFAVGPWHLWLCTPRTGQDTAGRHSSSAPHRGGEQEARLAAASPRAFHASSLGTGKPKPRDHEIIQVGGDPGRSPVQLSAPAVSGQLARGCVPPALGHVPGRRSQSLQGEATHCLLPPAAKPLL